MTFAATRRVFWVLGAPRAVGAPPLTPLGELTALPQTL